MDGVRIVCRDTSQLDSHGLAAASALLPADELGQAQRFRFPEDARDYAAAHALLRRELSRGSPTPPQEWRFDRGPHGKPILATDVPTAVSFSLSHTRGMVACALAPPDVLLGVDVESSQRPLETTRLAARYFVDTEIAALERLPDGKRLARFYDLWTMKEAIVKALGIALPAAMQQIALEIDGNTASVGRAPVSIDGSWQLAFFTPATGYRLAVAAMRPPQIAPLAISCTAADEPPAQPRS